MSSTKTKAKFILDEDGFTIKNLVITKEETIESLKDLDKGKYERFILKAIEIGIRVISEQKTFDKVDYVEKQFQKLSFGMQKQMADIEVRFESIFGEEGVLADFSDEEIGIPAKVRASVMDEKIGLKAYLNPLRVYGFKNIRTV